MHDAITLLHYGCLCYGVFLSPFIVPSQDPIPAHAEQQDDSGNILAPNVCHLLQNLFISVLPSGYHGGGLFQKLPRHVFNYI